MAEKVSAALVHQQWTFGEGRMVGFAVEAPALTSDEWEQVGLLAEACERFVAYCQQATPSEPPLSGDLWEPET